METIAKWMIEDIKMAYAEKTSIFDNNWINYVEPETMDTIKKIWLNGEGHLSLMNVFYKYLKL